jgi:hypothetical protein
MVEQRGERPDQDAEESRGSRAEDYCDEHQGCGGPDPVTPV